MEENQHSSDDHGENAHETALVGESRPVLNANIDNANSIKTTKKRSQTSATAWALLITILLGVGLFVALNLGILSIPTDPASNFTDPDNYLGISASTWLKILAVSVILTAVSTTIAMFATLTMSANISNIGESIEDIKESLRRK